MVLSGPLFSGLPVLVVVPLLPRDVLRDRLRPDQALVPATDSWFSFSRLRFSRSDSDRGHPRRPPASSPIPPRGKGAPVSLFFLFAPTLPMSQCSSPFVVSVTPTS